MLCHIAITKATLFLFNCIIVFFFRLLPLGVATADHLYHSSILLCHTKPLYVLLWSSSFVWQLHH